jgi:hypothetical protein
MANGQMKRSGLLLFLPQGVIVIIIRQISRFILGHTPTFLNHVDFEEIPSFKRELHGIRSADRNTFCCITMSGRKPSIYGFQRAKEIMVEPLKFIIPARGKEMEDDPQICSACSASFRMMNRVQVEDKVNWSFISVLSA